MKAMIVSAALALVAHGPSFAQTLVVDKLPSEYCSGDTQNGVLRASGYTDTADTESACILEFAADKQGTAYESEAVVSVNGKLVKIFRTQYVEARGSHQDSTPTLGERRWYVFYSTDKKTKVSLFSRVIDSSCSVNTDSCCGDSYKGTLTIERKGKRVIEAISYYRGG